MKHIMGARVLHDIYPLGSGLGLDRLDKVATVLRNKGIAEERIQDALAMIRDKTADIPEEKRAAYRRYAFRAGTEVVVLGMFTRRELMAEYFIAPPIAIISVLIEGQNWDGDVVRALVNILDLDIGVLFQDTDMEQYFRAVAEWQQQQQWIGRTA